MKKLFWILLIVSMKQTIFGQDIRVYHGERNESVFLKEHEKLENSSRESVRIIRRTNGIVAIHILNPNPFFYNYQIKTEDVDIKDDFSDQFAQLVKLINALPDLAQPSTNPFAGSTSAAQRAAALPVPGPTPPPSAFDVYKIYIEQLDKDIREAKGYIEKSDQPETIEEALKRVPNSAGFGFRAAVDNIKKLPSLKAHFNSSTLEKDLNDQLEAADADNTFAISLNVVANPNLKALYKSAFKGLNNRLVNAVNEILKVAEMERVIRFNVPVKENKQTNVRLVITKINKDDNVVRDLLNEEVVTVLPFYVRKTFEVVPVVNLIFQSNRQKFSIENNLVKSTPDDEAKFNIGAMALMNFASFGEFKEYGVGIGIGYSMQPEGKASSFFAIPSLSYKDIFRVGFGFGYNLAPVGLKNGLVVGSTLPASISNIEDVVEYRRKPAAVFTIAISGLKF